MTSTSRLARTYFIGFGLSVVLTVGAFMLATMQKSSTVDGNPDFLIMMVLVVLAIAQLVVQLIYFFHLGKEARPRLNLVSFLFMLMVVGIIAFGSVWIMYNLNYNMHGREVEQYIQHDEGIKPSQETHHH